jgi:hypothetical protein
MAITLKQVAIGIVALGIVGLGLILALKPSTPKAPAATGFQNDEIWDVTYDDQGNITSVHVSRKVSPSGPG